MKSIKQEDCDECLSAIAAFYTTDFDPAQQKLHLDVLSSNFLADLHGSVTVIDDREYRGNWFQKLLLCCNLF